MTVRTSGFHKARGELVAFLDHDNIWLPETLDLQVQALHTWPESCLVFRNGEILNQHGPLAIRISRVGLLHEFTSTYPEIAAAKDPHSPVLPRPRNIFARLP